MAVTITPVTTHEGIVFPAGDNDRLTYDRDDAANAPTVVPGGLTAKAVTITFDSSYPTGGEAIAANDVQMAAITDMLVGLAVKSDGSDALRVQWDQANGKLLAFRSAASAGALQQVPNTTDLSAYSCRALVFGHRVL